jgi:hypothetical protein
VTLDGSPSSDPDGTVATYIWDFGDGSTATTTEPTTSHRFAGKPRPVTLTVTDDEGCSTTQVYTGQDTLCNGSAVATLTSAGIDGAKVKVKPTQEQDERVIVEVKVGAAEAIAASAKGKIIGAGKAVPLKKAAKEVKAGKRKTLKLKPKKPADDRRLAGVLADGAKAKAKLTVKLAGEAGDSLQSKETARLKG